MRLYLALVLLMSPLHQAARILLAPYGPCMNSHLVNCERLAQILHSAGHNISMLLSDQYDVFIQQNTIDYPPLDGINLLTYRGPDDFISVCEHHATIDFTMNAALTERFDHMVETSLKFCENMLSDPNLLRSIKQEQFDLLMIESLDPCAKILADYLDIPFIVLTTAGLGQWDGNPRNPSYVPAPIAPFQPIMSFPQRLANFIMKNLYERIPDIMGFNQPFEELKVKYGLNTSLQLKDTVDRAALKFVNSHVAIDYATPIEPDTILVGGFAVREPSKVNDDIQDFLDTVGDEGLVVVSFGSMIKRYDQKWTRLFMDTFENLTQKVIWRYAEAEEDAIIKDNSHIKLVKWLPQSDLLAFNKTKVFISHGGLNGALESAYFGVPVIFVPMSGDHFFHATKLADYAGMGKQVDISTLTSQHLAQVIKEVIDNPEYETKAKAISQRMRDDPVSAQDKITFWTEYVLRHKDVSYLKSPSHRLAWYQYFCLDILVTLMITLLVILTMMAILFIKLIRLLFRMVPSL